MKVGVLLGGFTALSLSGCVQGPQDIVPKPTDVDIGNAIMQVRDGLVAAQQKSKSSNEFAGLYPCTIQVVFNVTAKADRSNTLVIDAAIKPPATVPAPSLSVSDKLAQTSEASRGNQITVLLTSSLCIPSMQPASATPAAGGVKPAPPPATRPNPSLTNPRPLLVPPPLSLW